MHPKKSAFVTLTAAFAFPFLAAAQSPAPQSAPDASHVITMVNVQASLAKAVDAKKAKAGDPVVAKVSAPVVLSDGTHVPAGSLLEGQINSVTPSENKGDSTLVLTIDKLKVKNGNEIGIKATVTQIESLVPAFGQDKSAPDPSEIRPGSLGNRGEGNSSTPDAHAIEGLTLSGTTHDATSATFTQAKKNVHLPDGALLMVSVAAVPPGVKIQ